jgi:SLA1 homology domain 1, SHD1
LFGPATKDAPKTGGAPTTTQKPAGEDKTMPATMPAGKDKKDEKPKTDEKDPLLGSAPSVLHEAGGLASDEMRQWTDNTGNFSCRGRLVRFYDGQVRLLKSNGRTATVPLARLSTGDLEFVNRQASAQQSEVGKTAQSSAMMPNFAN